jgi:predicted transcriptional regulator
MAMLKYFISLKKNMALTVNINEKGLSMFISPYQQIALQCIWEDNTGKSSRQVWKYVNQNLDNESISRASIINFLNRMVDEGLLNYETTTGKGGYRRIYYQKYSPSEFKEELIKTTINALKESFPEETLKAISSI